MPANILLSAYGRNGFANFINAAVRENRILFVNEEKSHSLEKILSVQFANNLFKTTALNESISNEKTTVNTNNMSADQKTTPENTGATKSKFAELCDELNKEVAEHDREQAGKIMEGKESEPRKEVAMTNKERSEAWQRKIQAARNVPIEQVIAGQGYTLTGKGNILSTAEHDSMKIYLKTNSYIRFSTRKGGTPIDFLINECGYERKDAIELLAAQGGVIENTERAQISRSQQKAQEDAVPFVMPPKADNNRRIYAYLSSRGLNGKIIHDFIKKGLLYESADKHNCVFVGRDNDGNVKAGYMRGTYTMGSKQYKGNVPGSDKQYGIFHEGEKGCKDLYCFEAPIDLMSHIQLTGSVVHRLALCGLDDTTMKNVLEKHPEIETIYFCLDVDKRGQKATRELGKKYAALGYKTFRVRPPVKKDWNEYLQYKNAETAKIDSQNLCQ